MFSRRTKHALNILTVIAEADINEDKRLKQYEIAAALDVSVSWVEALVSDLRAAGLVEGKKGPGGGLFIDRDVNAITIAEVADAMEGTDTAGSYPIINQVIRKAMSGVFLSDLLKAA